ncbi:MAG: hypothetical protein EB015_11515 [Methylocystaceae bacterium]|nr:hypothetical protein [Methylocystaceae bacterium]
MPDLFILRGIETHIRKTSETCADLELLRNSQISLLLADISLLLAKSTKQKTPWARKPQGVCPWLRGPTAPFTEHAYETP